MIFLSTSEEAADVPTAGTSARTSPGETPADSDAAQVEDTELVRRYRESGDERAFSVLVRRHADAIRRIAYLALGDRQDVDEVEQEVRVSLARAVIRFDARSSFRTFLYRIVRNRCADLIRRRVRERKRRRAIDRAAFREAVSREIDPQEIALARIDEFERRAQLREALSSLAQRDRVLLYLHAVEGLSIAELAEVYASPEGTVKARLHRARHRLARILQEGGKP